MSAILEAESFKNHLTDLIHAQNRLQKRGLERFLELGLPSKKNESFRHLRMRSLYSKTFQKQHPFLDIPLREGVCVFVNGCYQEKLSSPPKEWRVMPLKEALNSFGTFLEHRIENQLQAEKNPFAALNLAMGDEGAFFYLPPKTICKTPLHIVHYIEGEKQLSSPRAHVFVGKNASGTLYTSQHLRAQHSWNNSFLDIAIEEAGFLELVSCFENKACAWHFDAIRATLARTARLKSLSLTNGAAMSRQDYVVRLQGEGSDAALQGMWNLKDLLQHHVHVLVEHKAPHTKSLQRFKGALFDKSYSSFDGTIFVHKEAQKTDAYQMNNNLLLNSRARAVSKPNLEIFADDVKASHGSTTGMLNQDHLLYLQTRGIPKKLANKLLVEGFIAEMMHQIPEILKPLSL